MPLGARHTGTNPTPTQPHTPPFYPAGLWGEHPARCRETKPIEDKDIMKNFTSDQFTWKDGHGIAHLSSLTGGDYEDISRFTVLFVDTGRTHTYELDNRKIVAGVECSVFTDNLWDGTRVTIIHA